MSGFGINWHAWHPVKLASWRAGTPQADFSLSAKAHRGRLLLAYLNDSTGGRVSASAGDSS